MSPKSARRAGWEHATPRGYADLVRHARGLTDEERVELRRALVDTSEAVAERVAILERCDPTPGVQSAIQRNRRFIETLEATLAKV